MSTPKKKYSNYISYDDYVKLSQNGSDSPIINTKRNKRPKVKQKKINGSNGEYRIKQLLDTYKIPYITQMSFHDCINPRTKKELTFDFYIPHINTLIEYDGMQHHTLIYGQKGEHLHSQIYRDTIKNNYCKEKGFNLVRIPSWKYSNLKFEIKSICGINKPLKTI